MKHLVLRLLAFLLCSTCAAFNHTKKDPTLGRSIVSDSVITSVLCHVMEIRATFSNAINATTTFDHGVVCETTLPGDASNNRTESIAMWIYRIKNLPLNVYRDLMLDQEQQEQTWVHFTGILRNDAAALLEFLPSTTITLVPRPTNIVSVTDATITANNNAAGSGGTRQLTTTYQNMGINYILVVRVTWHGISPKVTGDELRGRIFGMGRQPQRRYNLRRQLSLCSNGKLLMAPAPPIQPTFRSSESRGIYQGVSEMRLTTHIEDDLLPDSVKILENQALETLVAWYGQSYLNRVNHIMIVLPDHKLIQYNNGGKLIAYAYLKAKLSVFSDFWATSISALGHEIGHGFGLHHSGEAALSCGDTTGFMGYGSPHTQKKAFCYNAQKNWFLKWYDDRALALSMPPGSSSSPSATTTTTTLDTVLPWTGSLAAFVDYKATSPDQPVLLRIDSDDQEKRLYLQWNRAKSFNQGTREYRNDVVIVGDTGDLQRQNGVPSTLEAAIKPPPIGSLSQPLQHTWNITDFASQTLHVQVCQQVRTGRVDSVLISVFLNESLSGCPKPIHLPDCEDSPPSTSFWIRKNFPNQRQRNCIWLARRSLMERKDICQYTSDIQSAYHLCPETCGKCVDKCEDDSDVLIRINSLRGQQSCNWLSSRPLWQAKLCYPGSEAQRYCRESCNSCENN